MTDLRGNAFRLADDTERAAEARAQLDADYDTGRKPVVYGSRDGLYRPLRLYRDAKGYYVRVGKRGTHQERLVGAERIAPGIRRYFFIY